MIRYENFHLLHTFLRTLFLVILGMIHVISAFKPILVVFFLFWYVLVYSRKVVVHGSIQLAEKNFINIILIASLNCFTLKHGEKECEFCRMSRFKRNITKNINGMLISFLYGSKIIRFRKVIK